MRKPSSHPKSKMLKWTWKRNLLPKIKFFLWLVVRGVLLTYEFLSARKIEIPIKCHFCSQNVENIDHIFRKCTFVQGIWDCIEYNCPTPLFHEGEYLSWLEMIYKNYKSNCKLFNHPMENIDIIMWNVWTHRIMFCLGRANQILSRHREIHLNLSKSS